MPRFLITDDDNVTHAYMRHILIAHGEVSHAVSGRQAVEACPCREDAYVHKPLDRRSLFAALARTGLTRHQPQERGEDFW